MLMITGLGLGLSVTEAKDSSNTINAVHKAVESHIPHLKNCKTSDELGQFLSKIRTQILHILETAPDKDQHAKLIDALKALEVKEFSKQIGTIKGILSNMDSATSKLILDTISEKFATLALILKYS